MNKKLKLVISYGIWFVLGILFCLISLIIALKLSLFNDKYIINHMKKTNYYQELYEDIKTNMTYYTNQSGFEDDILDDTFTVDMVKNDVNNFITNIYNNKKYTVDTSEFENALNKKIDDFTKKENFTIINRDDINKFVSDMAKVYTNKIKLSGYADKLIGIFNRLINKINKLFVLLIIFSIILFLINIFFFKRRNIGVVLFTNTFLLFSCVIFIKTTIKIDSILIYSKILSKVLISSINGLLLLIIMISLLSFITGIILSFIRKKKDVIQ